MDLLEYKASLIWNLVTSGSIMFALLEPLNKFVVPHIIFTLAFVNIKSRKHLVLKNYMCGWTINETYISIIHLEI